MRDNRMKTGVHVYHRQGRSNSYNLCKTMGEKLKRKVTYADMYVETCLKKGRKDGFVSARAKETWENYVDLMSTKYRSSKSNWSDFDDKLWYEASRGGKKNGYYFGMPAMMNSENLLGGRNKFPVMDYIVSSGSNQVQQVGDEDEDDDEDEDEDEDPTYEPPKKKGKRSTSPRGKKVRPNVFEQEDYEEEEFDLDVVTSDSEEESSDEED